MDLEFLAMSGATKAGRMGNQPSAWHFRRIAKRRFESVGHGFSPAQVCPGQLPGDQKFTAISEPNRPSEELAAQERGARPALIFAQRREKSRSSCPSLTRRGMSLHCWQRFGQSVTRSANPTRRSLSTTGARTPRGSGSTKRQMAGPKKKKKKKRGPQKPFHFLSNHGQAAALFFGMKKAAGEILVTLDGDGQNDPADMPRLLAALADCDMVAGVRAGRQDSRLRLTMSRLANSVRSRLLGDGLRNTGCALKAFRCEVVEAFIPIRTLYSFMGAMAVAAGFRLRQLEVAHRPRIGGSPNTGSPSFGGSRRST